MDANTLINCMFIPVPTSEYYIRLKGKVNTDFGISLSKTQLGSIQGKVPSIMSVYLSKILL